MEFEHLSEFHVVRNAVYNVAEHRIGLDGTNNELELGHFSAKARIAWWIALPREWEAAGAGHRGDDRGVWGVVMARRAHVASLQVVFTAQSVLGRMRMSPSVR